MVRLVQMYALQVRWNTDCGRSGLSVYGCGPPGADVGITGKVEYRLCWGGLSVHGYRPPGADVLIAGKVEYRLCWGGLSVLGY